MPSNYSCPFFLYSSEIPQEKPIVQGARERYHPGDIVRINCTSAPSKPAATLTWYINDQVVSDEESRGKEEREERGGEIRLTAKGIEVRRV